MDTYKSHRLRIIDEGLHNYTGDFGLVSFENGVSTHMVGWREAALLSGIVRIEDADRPGHQLGGAADIERNRDRLADDPEVAVASKVENVNGEDRVVAATFTRAELEKIADEKGLSGVRDIARAWKRTGRSIQECIDAILDAQGRLADVPPAPELPAAKSPADDVAPEKE